MEEVRSAYVGELSAWTWTDLINFVIKVAEIVALFSIAIAVASNG